MTTLLRIRCPHTVKNFVAVLAAAIGVTANADLAQAARHATASVRAEQHTYQVRLDRVQANAQCGSEAHDAQTVRICDVEAQDDGGSLIRCWDLSYDTAGQQRSLTIARHSASGPVVDSSPRFREGALFGNDSVVFVTRSERPTSARPGPFTFTRTEIGTSGCEVRYSFTVTSR